MKIQNLILSATLLALPLLSGCGLTPAQKTSALVQGGAQAYGADYLTSQEVNGVVPAAVVTAYEANLAGIQNVMSGGIDPNVFQNTVQQILKTPSITPTESGAIGFLSSVDSTFVKANSNPLTVDGANVQAGAQQVAAGLAAALKQVANIAYVPPSS